MAYITTGYSGRVVEVDLQTHTARELSGVRSYPGYSGYNYGVAVDPIHGKVFMSDSFTQNVYLVNPSGSGVLTLLKDFGSLASYGGGITFAPDGRLIVPVPTSSS
jgi:DNA-binding beta-propeller fold protein YncE